MSKWFTCAPCRFACCQEAFFWRDSGLLTRGLQQLGHESKVVLPGPGFEGEFPDILRATLQEMESADWWRELKLDGVIMVAWARHRDTPIVRAIAASGTPLVLYIDGDGNPFPLFRQIETIKTFWRGERGTYRGCGIRVFSFLKTVITVTVASFLRHSYLKYRHLRHADVVALQTPTSVEGHQQLCSFYGGKNHGVNLQLAGIPTPTSYAWDPSIAKEKRMVAIGRWEMLWQKRPYVLMAVCASIARKHPDLHIDIFGTKTEALANWHLALETSVRERIHVHGFQPGKIVTAAVQKAQISFFPSSIEGGPLSMFECLACGVSTVGLDSPSMPGARWAAQCNHADLAPRDTTEAFVAAIERGLEKWERGEYSAQQISEYWIPRTRPQRILETMLLNAVEAKRASSPSNSPTTAAS